MMLCDDCIHAVICENVTHRNCDWYLSTIVTSNGDIIDFNGQVVGHINLEDMKGGKE